MSRIIYRLDSRAIEAIGREIRHHLWLHSGGPSPLPPPFDVDLEATVAAEALGGRVPPTFLTAQHFFTRLYGAVYGSAASLLERGVSPTPELVTVVLNRLGYDGERVLEDSRDLLARPACFHIERAARRLVQLARQRDALRLIAKLDLSLRSTDCDVPNALLLARGVVDGVSLVATSVSGVASTEGGAS